MKKPFTQKRKFPGPIELVPREPRRSVRAARGEGSSSGAGQGANAIPPALRLEPAVVPPKAKPKAEKEIKPAEMTLTDLIARWKPAPWLFVRECLSAEPDGWQDECLHAVIESGFEKFALKACKGPGKSCLLAWIILWFMLCHVDAKVVAASITGENLRDNLWTELALWIAKSSLLKIAFEWQTERVFLRERPETWFCSARTWPKDADKTKQANTLAGIHGQHTLVILDEAGDIPEGVLAAGLAHHATQGTGAKEIHITLIAGNPTRLDGALGVACTTHRAEWWVKEITGDPKDPNRAPRIKLSWAQGEIDRWGPDSPWVLVNVFGKFPPTQDNKLLGPDIVRAAMALHVPEPLWRNQPKIMGVDVARSLLSDKSAIARRQGPIVFPFKTYRIEDLMELSSQVAFEFARWKANVIFIDMTGLGGGVVDRLLQLGLPAIGVNFGAAASDNRFADKRSEMWWEMHLAIKGHSGEPTLALPNDSELVTELTGPLVFFNDRSKLKLESKEQMKKRGLASPDLADSLCLTWAEPIFPELQVPASTQEALGINHAVTEYDPYKEV